MKLFNQHKKYPEWVTLLSTVEDGPMPTSSRIGDLPLTANRQEFLQSHQIDPMQLVTARLVHGTEIHAVTNSDGGKIINHTDGLSTNIPGLNLTITVADCLPIYFFDIKKRVVAIAHAGWRGLAANIILGMVNHLKEKYGSRPADLVVGVGPGISQCHYEVGSEVATQFTEYIGAVKTKKDRTQWLDLRKVASQQLLDAGVISTAIEIDERCTFEIKDLFSFRRSRDLAKGVMMAITGLGDNN